MKYKDIYNINRKKETTRASMQEVAVDMYSINMSC